MDGIDCDVSNPASVARLASYAKSKLGRIDVWINNAGYSGSFQVHNPPLLLSLLCEHGAAMRCERDSAVCSCCAHSVSTCLAGLLLCMGAAAKP